MGGDLRMDISFIIPAWNEKNTIHYTIANLRQTVKHNSFEIIVVDDCSDEELAPCLSQRDHVVYLRNPERLGVAKSRNQGARAAKGSVLIFLDAHVCFSRNWLDDIMKKSSLLEDSILGVATAPFSDLEVFRRAAISLKTPKIRSPFYGYLLSSLPTPSTQRNFVKRSDSHFAVPCVPACSLVVKKDLFLELGCFEDELTGYGSNDDLELCMRCWVLGYKVLIIPEIVCYHCYEGSRLKKYAPLDYSSRPFYSEKHDRSVDNPLRVLYLHLPSERFQWMLDCYKDYPLFKPDLDRVITEQLKARRRLITQRSKYSDAWLFERMARIG